jgi:hypothetical protein
VKTLVRRRYRRSINWGRILALVIFITGTLVVLAVSWLGLLNGEKSEATRQWFDFPQLNCRYLLPERGWEPDAGDLKSAFKTAALVLRRSSPEAWMALLVQDCRDGTPPENELREEAIRRLGAYFSKENLEWERGGDIQVAGLPGQRVVFKGEVKHKAMSGECCILCYQGLAYYIVTWAPVEAVDTAQKEFPELRKRFVLLGDRKGWSKQQAPRTLLGHQADYRLQNVETIWEEWMPPTDFDGLADLVLVARETTKPAGVEDGRVREASVVVLILKNGQKDPPAAVMAVQAHLTQQQKSVYPDTTIEPADESSTAAGQGDRPGSFPGKILRLRVKNAEKRHRFVLLGVVNQPDFTLALECECAWGARTIWQPRFEQVLGTFRLEPAKGASNQGGEVPEPE